MRLFRTILISLSALIAVGCGDGGVQSPDFTPQLQELRITPLTASVPAGRTAQFSAVGVYTTPPGSGSSTEEREVSGASWSVSNDNASIDGNGLATGNTVGTVQISASFDGVDSSNTATLTVTDAVLDSITIEPPSPTIPLGSQQTLTANGTYSDGSTAPVAVQWTSSNEGTATVTPGPSTTTTASSVAQGSTTITATSGSVQGTTTLTVGPFEPVVSTITVSPDTATQPLGRPQEFTVTGQCTVAPFSPTLGPCPDGTIDPSEIDWTVADADIATIDASGIARGIAIGSTTVTATLGSVSDTASFTVTQAVVQSLVVTPSTATIPAGGSQAFTASAVFTDGSTGPVVVDWTTSVPGIATLAPATGATTTATGVAPGSTSVVATTVNGAGETIEGEASLTVTGVVLEEIIRVETAAGEPQGRVTPGRSIEFVAIGRFSDDTEVAIDDEDVIWSSSNTAIATIEADGFATGVTQGQVQITATRVGTPSDSASATLTVTDPVCTTELLASEGATVVEFTSPLCVGCTVENEANIINANDEDFATVLTPVGLLGATAGVTATPGGTTPVPFAAGNNAGFVIGKPAGTLLVAEVLSQVFVSTLLDGVVQETTSGGVTPLRVDLLGAQLLGGGTDTALVTIPTSLEYDEIRLSVNSGTASALSTVRVFQACATAEPPPPAATLTSVSRIEPAAVSVSAGATRGVVVYGAYSNGTEAPLSDADIDWTSSDASLATVDANGVVTGVAPGTVTVTATLKDEVATGVTDRSATVTVTVLANVCTVPLTAAGGATVTEGTTGICLLCSVSNTPNVIDDTPTTYATMNVPLALLGGTTVTVQSAAQLPGSGTAGFLISRPVGQLLQAELLSQIQVTTLLNGVVQQTSGPSIPLRADLLGIPLLGGAGETAVVSIQPTLPYNQLRLGFSSVLAAGLLESTLQTVNVLQACSTVTPPPAAP